MKKYDKTNEEKKNNELKKLNEKLNLQILLNSLKEIDYSKAIGPDLIHNAFIIKRIDILKYRLLKIFNLSYENAIVPDAWKLSNISPKQRTKTVGYNSRSTQYAIFALDMILTSDLELKLVEVQNSAKSRVFPQNCNQRNKNLGHNKKNNFIYTYHQWACDIGFEFAKETIDIALEIAWKVFKQIPHLHLLAKQQFTLVINGCDNIPMISKAQLVKLQRQDLSNPIQTQSDSSDDEN